MSVLLRSQLECPACGDIVASVHVHHMDFCKCGGTGIDGGRDYLRIIGNVICAVAERDGGLQNWDRSIRISGEHNNVSAASALEVYKALWAVTDGGKWATAATEVFRMVEARENRFKLTVRSVRAYLNTLCEESYAPVERVGAKFRPKIPLAEVNFAP